MIDQQTRERILESAQILDVVSDFVSLRKQGVSYVGLCPFHSDRKPSFSVSPSKNVCKCFSCGEGGSPLHFIMKHEQLSYEDALRYLAKKYNIEIQERELTNEERQAASERESLFIVNEYAQKYFEHQLWDTEEGQSIGLSYFAERGIRPETIRKFGLGYSPEGWSNMTDTAQKAGYKLERLVHVGLSIQPEGKSAIDRFRGRVIFPVRNIGGKWVAFGGRILGKHDKTAKYVNSPESSIYSKSRELYGLYWAKSAISKAGKCFLVEGYTDVLSLHQSGIENVVASSGTALTTQQIKLIRRFTEHVTLLYDGDGAGIKAALRGIDLLLEEGLQIKVVLLPEGEDPDSFAQKHSSSELLSYISEQETDFIHFKIQLYQEDMARDPMLRAQLITDILRSIALIPDSIRRAVLVQSSATLLRMDEQLLSSEVAKLRLQSRQTAPTPSTRVLASSSPVAPLSTAPTPEALPTTEHSKPAELATQAPAPREPYKHELELLHMLVCYGNKTIQYYDEEASDPYSSQGYARAQMAIFVHNELDINHIYATLSPITSTIITEAIAQAMNLSNESYSSYFANHPDPDIAHWAGHFLSDPYQSKSDKVVPEDKWVNEINPDKQVQIKEEEEEKARHKREQILGQEVLHALDNLFMTIVMQDIYKAQQDIQEAQRLGNSEAIVELIQRLNELNELKMDFAQSLGERTLMG